MVGRIRLVVTDKRGGNCGRLDEQLAKLASYLCQNTRCQAQKQGLVDTLCFCMNGHRFARKSADASGTKTVYWLNRHVALSCGSTWGCRSL